MTRAPFETRGRACDRPDGPGGERRLLCFTQDPYYGSSVPSLAEAVLGAASRRGIEASLAYFSAEQALSPLKLALGRWQLAHRVCDGSPRVVKVATFPFLEFVSNRLPRAFLAAEVARHSDHVAVLGHATSAAFLARAGVPYALWLASSREGEAAAQRGRWQRLDERLVDLANRPTERRCQEDERLALRRARRILVLSEAVREEILGLGVEPDTVSIVPPPIDLNFFSPAPQQAHRQQPPCICAVGRWDDPRKNVELLLDAVAQICRVRPEIELVLAGRHGRHLARAIRRRGLDETVTLTGVATEEAKRDLLRRATVFAMPSKQEGFGIGVAEAMACGTAVVATRTGGVLDLVDDGEHGLLVDHDAPAMAAAIERLLADEELRGRLAHAALARVRDRLEPGRVESLLVELLGFEGPPARKDSEARP